MATVLGRKGVYAVLECMWACAVGGAGVYPSSTFIILLGFQYKIITELGSWEVRSGNDAALSTRCGLAAKKLNDRSCCSGVCWYLQWRWLRSFEDWRWSGKYSGENEDMYRLKSGPVTSWEREIGRALNCGVVAEMDNNFECWLMMVTSSWGCLIQDDCNWRLYRELSSARWELEDELGRTPGNKGKLGPVCLGKWLRRRKSLVLLLEVNQSSGSWKWCLAGHEK